MNAWLDEYGGLDGATPVFTVIDEIDLPDIMALLKCRRCGHYTAGAGSFEIECRVGNCIEMCCVKCGETWGGWGPVDCPCQGRDPKIRRIRQLYRARQR